MSEKTKDSGLKASVQKLGSYLSSMVMPNIGSFIAWGIITALFISDAITRVARTPIRKLGYDERFIRPIREAKERGLSYDALLETVAYIFEYKDANDEQSQELQKMLAEQTRDQVIKEVTGLKDADLIAEIEGKMK